MHYNYLSEMGEAMEGEEGTSGARGVPSVWASLEMRLKSLITELRNLLAASQTAAVPQGGGRVKELIRAFEGNNARPAGAYGYAGAGATSEAYGETARPAYAYAGGPGPAADAYAIPDESRIAELRQEIERLRTWFAREQVLVDDDGNVDYNSLGLLVVVYDWDADLRDKSLIRIQSGRLFTDERCTAPLDTSKMVTHFSGPGKAIYVMDRGGNLHVDSHVLGHRHHSSLLAGRKVAGAGELEVIRGELRWLSNKSGHYQPSVAHLLQTLHQLQKKGVRMDFALSVMPSGATYASVGDFLAALNLSGEPDYELNKLMTYSRHLTPEILGRKGWRYWHFGDPQNQKGVYDIRTNQLVPHKTIRQWLKSQGLRADKDIHEGEAR